MFNTTLVPHRLLLFGFISIIFLCSYLLTLPVASASGNSQPFIDAMFIATSAISTTGLFVVDIGTFYSTFGQIIILVLIQIGGLGYMIFIVLVMFGLGVRLSLGGKLILEESVGFPPYKDIIRFSKIVILITFIFEFLGAICLSLYWMNEFPVGRAIYLGTFHSISAFCTAGFSLFPNNLSAYHNSIFVTTVVTILCLGGSIGFIVIYDIYYSIFGKIHETDLPKRMLMHTKLVLTVLPILIVTGIFLIYVSEWNTPSLATKDRLLSSIFHAISASTTTGFNTSDLGTMKTLGLTTMIVLMYIGASPGGTGGGVKTTTFGLLISCIVSVVSMKDEIILFNRRIPSITKDKAIAICASSILLIMIVILILSFTENASFMEIVFESASAFGTVGLSTGITSSLSTSGKLVICMTMLIGRVGPLAIGYSIKGKRKIVPVKYPEGVMLVG